MATAMASATFTGLIARLDYLHSLGVDVIWLAPFQPSPNRDNGYDISDFFGVDPRHGSSGDFVEFMQHAKKRGMRVIMDLVVNHTSDQHPWFKSARRDPKSQYRDWYIWSKQRPKGWNKGMVFPGVQKADWTRDPDRAGVLPPSLLRVSARPEHGQSRGASRDPPHHGLLAASSASTAFASMPCRSSSNRLAAAAPGRSCVSSTSTEMRTVPAVAHRRCRPARRSECDAEGESQVLRRRRRRHPHDVQLLRQSASVLRAGFRGRAAAATCADGDARDSGDSRSGRMFLRNHDELDLGRLQTVATSASCSSASVPSRDAALRPRHPPSARARCWATGGISSSRTA